MAKNETRRGKRRRPGKSVKEQAFLKAYSRVGNVTEAARIAKVDRQAHYKWLDESPTYPERFADAHEQAIDRLETEAVRRAVEGVDEPLTHKGEITTTVNESGEVVPVTVKKYSDVLLIFLLKGARPKKYRERYEVSGNANEPLEVNVRGQVQHVIGNPEVAELAASLAERLEAQEQPALPKMVDVEAKVVSGGNGQKKRKAGNNGRNKSSKRGKSG